MDKADIRKAIKAVKTRLTESEKAQSAMQCLNLVETLNEFKQSSNILLYASLPDELQTSEFIERWRYDKHLFLPRVNGELLDILPYQHDALSEGAFGISEPQGCNVVDIQTIDLVIVPAVAFDRLGNRLGRGRGYYDRLLGGARTTKLGIAYDLQIVEQLPTEAYDVKMDIIVTEKRIIRIN